MIKTAPKSKKHTLYIQHNMFKKTINSILAIAAIATAFSTIALPFSVSAQAPETTVLFTVGGGVLSLYAGDDTDDNDLCTPADEDTDGVPGAPLVPAVIEGVTCDVTQRQASLTGLTTTSVRQNTTANIDDILFEDLRGFATANYTLTARVGNFVDIVDPLIKIDLGSNPDGATGETGLDIPAGVGDENKLFAVIDPGTVETLRPNSAIPEVVNYTPGSRTTTISTITDVSIFTSADGVNPTPPSRTEIDGTEFKLRVPAFVQEGDYRGLITLTIV